MQAFWFRLKSTFSKKILYLILGLCLILPSCRNISSNDPQGEEGRSPSAETSSQKFEGTKIKLLSRKGVIGTGVRKRIAEFEKLTGAQIQLDTVPYGQLYDTLTADWSQANAQYDAAVVSPQWLIDFINAEFLADLTDRIPSDSALAWDDIAPFFRNALATQNNRIYGIPVDGDFLMVHYRTDLLQQANLQPPSTWDEYIAIAKQFHGQDLNGDGQPDFGSCLPKEAGDLGYFMFGGIVAPYLQAQGTEQGAFFSRDTMKPLVNNPAFSLALDQYKEMRQYGAPNMVALDLREARQVFLGGRCALTIDWVDIPVLAANKNISQVVDQVGAIVMPGSRQVLDHNTEELVNCDKFTCPYALEGVNHAPYAANLGYTGVVFANRPEATQNAAYAFLSYLSQPAQSNVDVTDGLTGFNPYRISQFNDFKPWIQSGMSREAANKYLRAVGASLSSDNMVLDLKLPFGKRYQLEVLDPVLAEFMNSQITNEEAMVKIEQGWEKITNEVGREQQKKAYRSSLGS